MDIQHHPEDELLVAFAAGNLEQAWALLTATHLALCPSCRTKIRTAETIGAALLEEMPPAVMADDALDRVLARATRPEARADSAAPSAPPEPAADGAAVLPRPLRDYAPGDIEALKWSPLGPNARHVPLVSARGAPTARLACFSAGAAIPGLGHDGLEVILVLAGNVLDGGNHFHRGDVVTTGPDVERRPVAGAAEDCVCLVVTDAP